MRRLAAAFAPGQVAPALAWDGPWPLAGGALVVCVAAGASLATRGPSLVVSLIVGVLACVGGLAVLQRPIWGSAALGFVLAAFPVLRFHLGSIPVYVTDVLLGLVFVSLWRRGLTSSQFGRAVAFYLLLWIPVWAVQVARLGIVLDPTYGVLRGLAAVSAFFIGVGLVRLDRVRPLLIALIVGTVATSIIAVGQEMGGTSSAVRSFLLRAAPAFTPAGYKTYPSRAFAFFTAPTTLSGFLAISVLILIGSAEYLRRSGRVWAVLALVPVSLGLIATYSRQWLPALAVGLLVLGLLRPRSFGRALVAAAAMLVVAWVALSGGTLDRSYLDQRFSTLGSQDANVLTRVQRQKQFFTVVGDNPVDLFTGRGFSAKNIVARNDVSSDAATQLQAGTNDNVFLIEVLDHGLFAGVAYVLLMLAAVRRGIAAVRRGGAKEQPLLAGLTAALVAALVLHLFDNYFATAAFMRSFLWLLVGLVVGLSERTRALAPAEDEQ